ncbi:MAG: DUF2089 domain-containing protein [Myxococcaceae bacterium]
MTRELPTRCPLCSGAVEVEKVGCLSCGSKVEGHFGLDWLGALSKEQLAFVKVFLICRGKIKDVEEALGLSYPTVVARLDDLVASLGRPAESAPAPANPELSTLEQLSKGLIDIDEAERRLKRRKP